MKYQEFEPGDPLSNYIQLIWILESESEQEVYQRNRILPDGIVEVIFHYESPFITCTSDGTKMKQPQGFAISQMRKFIEIESDGKIGFISVRFYPWGAYHFFEEPINNFLDDTIDLANVWPDQYETIMKDIYSASNDAERVKRVKDFLLKRLCENKNDYTSIDKAVRLIRSSKGQMSLEEIGEKTGFSKKQLERKFLTTVGTSPKVFSRISRFLHICKNLEEQNGKILTQLAYECGYFDQSHFIKEFKEFSGFTPKAFFEKNNVVFADM
ncbi:helix-turn-helix transcriptional regulator [Fulvivirgaceae bacterium BMA10]|uniref:Helix-turn-helix transcriptional regulator n=1 Tax=Splendidivirga corallicola TaxID=3051826 RepID=A0ABT8KXV8_9BACT|nr:helix-turn-helix transcriptional regulator [Fulvivirgaceae bacterium BMA10]